MKVEYVEKALDRMAAVMKAVPGWDGYTVKRHRGAARMHLFVLKVSADDLDGEPSAELAAAHALAALALELEAADAVSAATFENDWLPQPAAGAEAESGK
jgi:hypothetical protein